MELNINGSATSCRFPTRCSVASSARTWSTRSWWLTATQVVPAPRRRRPVRKLNRHHQSRRTRGGGARHGAFDADFVGGGVTFAAKPRSFARRSSSATRRHSCARGADPVRPEPHRDIAPPCHADGERRYIIAPKGLKAATR